MSIEIIYEDDTELAEYEALVKGYRGDIIVKIGNKKYKVYVVAMLRLQQDFEREQECSGYYLSEPNTILVEEASKEEIEAIITKMYKCKYFQRLDNMGF